MLWQAGIARYRREERRRESRQRRPDHQGERQEDKKEKKKDYYLRERIFYLRERNFGSFELAFRVPDGVDADKIDASFKNGVLTVTLPKKLEAQKATKKIENKAA
jgi:HSP20 family protein